jgi:hypothetical protein
MELSDREQQMFWQAIASVRQSHAEFLRTQTKPLHLTSVPLLHQAIDQIATQTGVDTPVACRAGCSDCCHQRQIEVTTLEARYIVQRLLEDVCDIDALRQRLQACLVVSADDAHPACPLLENHQCSIYAYRPAVCRKAHSLDVLACAERAAQIPQHLERILKSEAWMQGVELALQEAGQPQQRRTLAHALLELLPDSRLDQTLFQRR